MGQYGMAVAVPGAVVHPLDDLPMRLGKRRVRFHLAWTALVLSVLGLPVVFFELLIRAPLDEGLAFMLAIYGPLLGVVWLLAAAFMLVAALNRYAGARRTADRRRGQHVAVFQWFEVWAVHPSAPPTRPWNFRHHTFLQLFVHPDPAVPRFLTQGTDLVVTGGCTADDLRMVTGHLDLVLHRAMLLGLEDPRVQAAIRRVPKRALLVPYGRRRWEVHDPAAAHALIASDLASGWPSAALVARYRELLSARAAAR